MKRVALLGSTGSIGENACAILASRRDRYRVVCLTARCSGPRLAEQARDFAPAAVCLVADGTDLDLPPGVQRYTGAEGLIEALEASRPDLVLNAITGAAGLPASAWTLERGTTLALANKESMVVAGEYLNGLAAASGATILPVDSEHCAVFQCLQGEDRAKVRTIHLTASGGPFRQRPLAAFDGVTPQEALQHPTWDMGPRITIGSATLMNKAFEVVEAHWLFGLAPEQIKVVVHPQSIVHSMVEFVDGSMLAQLGVPDMRVPIHYCLSWPERTPYGFEPFDPVRWARLEFEAVDERRFAAIPLAYRVLERGGDSGAVLNAADEVLTEAFLAGRIPFPAITDGVRQVLEARPPAPADSLDRVLAADRGARQRADDYIAQLPISRS